MPRIIFVRPAETGNLLGRSDVDLNETGRHAATVLGQALAPYQADYLASTPLKRAYATAAAIEDYSPQLSAHPVAAFQAMDMGDWENMTRHQIIAEDEARYRAWLTDPDFRTPGGESVRDVYGRSFPELINKVHHALSHETLIIVLQETVLRVLSCAVLDLPLEHAHRLHMEKAAYSVFERIFEDGPYQLLAWNRQAQLSPTEEEAVCLYEEPVAT